jgi:hypothetical protein
VVRPALSAAEAAARIPVATHRNQIGEAVVDFLRSTFGSGLLLMVRDEMALGWLGFSPGVEADTLESAAIPLSPPSAFKFAYERRMVFRGAPPAEGSGLHTRLWKLLRAPPPQEIIVAPVLIKDRVVSLLYAHLAGGGALPAAVMGDVTLVCSSASAGFVRLIQNAKSRL